MKRVYYSILIQNIDVRIILYYKTQSSSFNTLVIIEDYL